MKRQLVSPERPAPLRPAPDVRSRVDPAVVERELGDGSFVLDDDLNAALLGADAPDNVHVHVRCVWTTDLLLTAGYARHLHTKNVHGMPTPRRRR